MLEKQILQNYEKALRGEFPQFYFFLINYIASSRLEDLFEVVGLTFISFKEDSPVSSFNFNNHKYFIPKSAFIIPDGQENFIWLDGDYARAFSAHDDILEMLVSADIDSFNDFLEKKYDLDKIIIYEAKRVDGRDGDGEVLLLLKKELVSITT